MKPQLFIFDTDKELIQQLKSQSAHMPYVRYAVGDGLTVTKAEKLDALKVTLMTALEHFGWNPPYPPFEACVLKTPSADVARGMPRYGISGVALPKNYPRDNLRRELKIVISAMLKAVKRFNSSHEDQILRIGILPEELSLKRLPPAEVFQMLKRIYEDED